MTGKIKHNLSLRPDTLRDLRVLSAFYGVTQGAAVAALLTLAGSRPVAEMAAVMAAHDDQAGELVPAGVSTADYIVQVRALAAVPDRVDA